MSVEKERWDEELERLGKASVTARLGIKEASGAGPNADFRLWVSGLRDPPRRYVEEWLQRKEAEEKATEAKRFWCIFVAAVLAVIVGVIAAWPVVRDWIK
jgi:hypothetical protein